MPTVVLPRLLGAATGGRLTLEVRGNRVDNVIAGLLEEAPGLEVHLFDHSGRLRPHVLCFIDGQATRLADRRAPLDEAAEIRFLQAVSGGGASRVGRLNTNQRA